jgi:hypothetical protein
MLLGQISTDVIIDDIKILVRIYIAYLLLEAFFRYTTVLLTEKDISNFLTFKFWKNGLLGYSDSNFHALNIQNVMCLVLFLFYYTKDRAWFKKYLMLFFFLILTLSRAAIVTQAFILLLIHWYILIKERRCLVFLAECGFLAIVFFNGFIVLYNNSYSFRIRFDVLRDMRRIYEYDLHNVLFGFGFEKGIYAYSFQKGAAGHLHIAIITGIYGLLGLFLYVIFFLVNLFQTRGGSLLLILSFVISGFALVFLDVQLFWVFGIITVLSERRGA